MTRFSHKALALGTAVAIATASSAFAGPIGPAGTQVKQAVPSAATDVRIRRGAAIAAGVAIGVGAAAIAASSYNYGYGYGYAQPYGYAEPYGYESGYGPYSQGGVRTRLRVRFAVGLQRLLPEQWQPGTLHVLNQPFLNLGG